MTHRTVQPQRCEKCNGTGQIVGHDDVGMFMAPCPHLRRTDVTGLSDDEERILALEAEVQRLRGLVDIGLRVVAENDEAKALLEAAGVDRWSGRSILEMVKEAAPRVASVSDLERRLCDCVAAVDRARDEGLEMAAQLVTDRCDAWGFDAGALGEEIRALKGDREY